MNEPKSKNITWHAHRVSKADLEELHGHRGATVWFTGLSASGKSTLANATAVELHKRGVSTFVLDGDNIRHGLNKDLGFAPDDREENVRRIGELAKLFTDAGIVNMAAFISPYRSDRDNARALQPEEFLEVYCEASLAVCEARDPKGIYKKARDGKIKCFTGIDAPYEAPENAELCLDTGSLSIDQCVRELIALMERRGIIDVNRR